MGGGRGGVSDFFTENPNLKKQKLGGGGGGGLVVCVWWEGGCGVNDFFNYESKFKIFFLIWDVGGGGGGME